MCSGFRCRLVFRTKSNIYDGVFCVRVWLGPKYFSEEEEEQFFRVKQEFGAHNRARETMKRFKILMLVRFTASRVLLHIYDQNTMYKFPYDLLNESILCVLCFRKLENIGKISKMSAGEARCPSHPSRNKTLVLKVKIYAKRNMSVFFFSPVLLHL